MSDDTKALEMATLFHDTYERLAPDFGYETRKDTRTFDPNSANGRLMIAVCTHVTKTQYAQIEHLERELAEVRKTVRVLREANNTFSDAVIAKKES